MEFYFETSFMRFGILIGVAIVLMLILVIYFDLKSKNKDQDIDLKITIAESGRHNISVGILIVIILLLTLKGVPDVIEYYRNLVKVEQFYVEEMNSNNAGTDYLHVYGTERMKLSTRLSGEKQEIVEEYFVGHWCEIEYGVYSKTVRRIKVIE